MSDYSVLNLKIPPHAFFPQRHEGPVLRTGATGYRIPDYSFLYYLAMLRICQVPGTQTRRLDRHTFRDTLISRTPRGLHVPPVTPFSLNRMFVWDRTPESGLWPCLISRIRTSYWGRSHDPVVVNPPWFFPGFKETVHRNRHLAPDKYSAHETWLHVTMFLELLRRLGLPAPDEII